MKPFAALGLAALGFAPAAFGADQPVPAAKEPHHRIDLENAYVRTLQVTLQPNDQTDFHVHAIPSVVVELSRAQIVADEWGHAPDPLRTVNPGDTRYAPYDEKPLTHQVSNRGTTVFDVMDIELLQPNRKPAAGFPPAPPEPAKLLFEKNQVRAYRLKLDPGASWKLPASPAAHLIVAYAGDLNSIESGHERFVRPQHAVDLRNPGTTPAEAIILELETTTGT